MAGLLLCGLATYPSAAGRGAAQRQLPDHPGDRPVARRRSANHGVLRGDAARAADRPDSRRHAAHLDERAGRHPVTVQFELARTVDSAAVDVLAAINAASPYLPTEHPLSADDPESESGRDADPGSRAHLRHPAADHRRCLCGKHPAAEDLADPRRRPGRHRRPAEARDPHPGQSPGAGGPRHRPRRCPQRDRPGQCRSAERHAQQPAPDLYAQHQRSTAEARRLRRR